MDIKTLVENKARELKPLYDRMDKDAKLAHLNKYTLRYIDEDGNERNIAGRVSVTMPEPALYLNSVQSWILAANEQTTVEGNIADTQKTYIERFINDAYVCADEMRSRRGLVKLNNHWALHICGRGWICTRWRWKKDGEKTYLDALPVDVRGLQWEYGNDGLNWTNSITYRSPSDIESEYGIKPTGKTAIEVWDFFDGEKNEIWINKKPYDRIPNTLGYPPLVITPAPEGFVLLEPLKAGSIAHEGESIFFLPRDLYEPFNQLISIDLTMALRGVVEGYQIQDDTPGEQPPHPKIGGTQKTPKGSKYELIPKPDINMANRQSLVSIGDSLQKSGVSDLDVGKQISPMAPSALLLQDQMEIRNRIQSPRLEAIQTHKEQSSRMIIDQFIKLGLEGEIGKRGKMSNYSYKELGDPDDYNISYRLMSRSRKHELANAALAAAFKGTLSLETRIKDVLMSSEPKTEIARLRAEEAAERDPVLKMIREGFALIDEANSCRDTDEKERLYWEARRVAETAASIIKQQGINGFQPAEQTRQGDSSALSALIGRGG